VITDIPRIEYVTGIFDGEGYFTIRSTNTGYYGKIGICNTNSTLIHAIGMFLLRHGIQHSIYHRKRSKRKPITDIHIGRKTSVATICSLLQPYSIIKKQHIELLLLLIDSDSKHEQQRLYKQMKTINRRGDA